MTSTLPLPVDDVEVDADADLVTVVIPARNEERFIARCLDSVLGQTYPRFEVVVVDGASSDRTPSIVAAYAARDPRVRLLHNPEAIVPISLNLAVAEAAGSWLVRVDAHATVGPDYVARAIAHLRCGEWQGAGGRVDSVAVTPAGRAIAATMSSRFGIGNSVHHFGVAPVAADHVPFPAYPTALVRGLGGWDETLAVNQDFELDYRIGQAGGRLLYDPEMVITYHGCQSIRAVSRQFRRYGRGKCRVVWLHPGSLRARHLAAPALVGSWVAAMLIGMRSRRAAVLVMAPYGMALTAASLATARRVPDAAGRLRVPAAFLAMHLSWGLGFWEGMLDQVRRRPG